MTRSFRLFDSTLRDGSHAIGHAYTPDQARTIVSRLDAAGVPVIEVAHGDGLGGSSFNYGFSAHDEYDLLRAALEARTTAKIAVMLLPGIGIRDDLRKAAELGVDVARIATHCTEADISEQHIGLARELGLEAVGFLMMSHMVDAKHLLAEARKMVSYGAQSVTIADSAGALTVDGVRQRIAPLADGLDVPVGLHAHHNLTLSVANSLAALSEGAGQVDGCTGGIGAGAGNCPTEILAAASARDGWDAGVDPLALVDTAHDVITPFWGPQAVDRHSLLLGYAGVYGSFLLHTKRAAERFGVDTKDVLLELGRRRVVGGQEDMIIDVAVELANRTAHATASP